jgi:RNA polymerase sigma-70 factor (ECF subfamily)
MIETSDILKGCNKTNESAFITDGSLDLTQETNDVELLKSAQLGKSESFGELYQKYARIVFRFIYAHVNDRLDAEDLTEEVFLRAWRSLSNFREQGVPFLAYLFKISRNVLIDFYRRAGRSGGHMSIEETNIQDSHLDPGEAAISNLEHQELRNTLDQLREDYRTVLVLRFLSGLSPDETGVVMGRTPGAVRILQHRALSALRNLLEI